MNYLFVYEPIKKDTELLDSSPTMTHIYKLLLTDSSKNSTFILKNLPYIRYSSGIRLDTRLEVE